jgi:indolepyruvate ferredoxin oxidoreductase
MERALIKEYEQDLRQIKTSDEKDAAIALAKLPLDIRGYGPVKEANAEMATKRRAELLAALDGKDKVKTAAE